MALPPFNDEVLCDIMPLGFCHILLGRSWQFDRHVVYDGRVNKYTAWKDGVTYTLLTLIETPDEMSFTLRVCMDSGKEFEKDMKENLVCFSIVPRKLSYASSDRVTEDSIN